MNPDVFITIAFSGIAVLVAVVPLAFVVPQLRREAARAERHESARRRSDLPARAPANRRDGVASPLA